MALQVGREPRCVDADVNVDEAVGHGRAALPLHVLLR